jgi:ribulose-phosphate 3-epimerase
MVQIIPAILATNEGDLDKDLSNLLNAESFKDHGWVHFDFMDNIFVPSNSVDPGSLKKYSLPLKKEAHLMVQQPLIWLDKLVELEFERIIIHIESEQILECLKYIKSKNIEAGLALNPETPLEKLIPFFDQIDLVLLMSVEPGSQGNQFLPDSFSRIKKLKESRKDFSFLIGDDGGIDSENVKKIIDAGCDNLVIGSHLIKGNIDENLEQIWERVNS